MTFQDIFFIIFILIYSGWALWRSALDIYSHKQRSTKSAERIIFVTERH